MLPIEGGGTKCVLDGITMDCGFIKREASLACQNNNCPKPLAPSTPPKQPHLVPRDLDRPFDAHFEQPIRSAKSLLDVISLAGIPQLKIPQRTVVGTEDLKQYKARISEMLTNDTCAPFIKELLNEAKAITKREYSDVLDTFDSIKFYWVGNLPSNKGGYAYFEGGKPVADIANVVKTERAFNAGRSEFLTAWTTHAFFGETLHQVGKGGTYGDGVMAQAINNVMVRKGVPGILPRTFDPRDTDTAAVGKASDYWHPKVEFFCHAPKK